MIIPFKSKKYGIILIKCLLVRLKNLGCQFKSILDCLWMYAGNDDLMLSIKNFHVDTLELQPFEKRILKLVQKSI